MGKRIGLLFDGIFSWGGGGRKEAEENKTILTYEIFQINKLKFSEKYMYMFWIF